MQNLQQQLQALETLRSQLIQFNNSLNELSERYNSSVNALVESGLPIQISENYSNSHQQRNSSAIASLVHMVEEEDIPYINRNVEALQELIERTQSR